MLEGERERFGLDRLSTAGLIGAAVLVAVTIIVLYRVLGVLMEEADLRDEAADDLEALKAEEYQKFLDWEARRGNHAEEVGAEASAGGEG